ncbi:hypothetical protein HNP33_001666 [Comamonas odontotermitis]|uniref:Uncharacterized protein n=1 Tax=Comamonas odontotermitis TaxID=379895 RepID=A0ABR6REM6_9BURK|nr:hypothetical protein [Comamonas odontotermitis]MBB6577609.1 hypothetical protein [Comamonas odontotermitis]
MSLALFCLAVAALWLGSRPPEPPPAEKATLSIRWTDTEFRDELTGMFPCDVIGMEVVTKGYALGEPVEVKVSGGLEEDPPEIFFPLVDHQGIARMLFQVPECREGASETDESGN